jgi:hypothetical protein
VALVYSLAVDSRKVDAISTWRDGIPYVFLNLQKTLNTVDSMQHTSWVAEGEHIIS